MQRRLFISLAIGILSAVLCYVRLVYGTCVGAPCEAGDFTWSLRGAEQLLSGQNPYHDPTLGRGNPYPNNDPLFYPLPALLIALPFVPFPREVGGALFFGISSGLLAFHLFRDGGYHRWPFFLGSSYWFTMVAVQWSPLIVASALAPALLPLALAKPNIGLPVFLSFLNVDKLVSLRKGEISTLYPPWRSVLVAIGVVLISLLILPSWPRDWLGNAEIHSVFVPILVFPGMFLPLALLRWRMRDARLLLLLALIPQRPVYDQLLLWLIPQTFRQMFAMSALSWITIFGWLLVPEMTVQWIVLGMYVPALVILLLKHPALPESA